MHEPFRVLDLFSGIGGFSLGLERTGGFRTVAFCEIEPYCQAVLRKHWPDVPIYDDVRTLPAIECDVICGGFPCQDLSYAGKGAGLAGERSGLWRDMVRTVGLARPRYAIVENVAALLSRGLGVVLSDLASIGYDAEWHCIPASAVGAPHVRDRLWIIAYPDADQLRASGQDKAKARSANLLEHGVVAAARVEGWRTIISDMDSAVYGFPAVVDCLRPLGNAVVPQIPEIIGRAILKAEGR